MKCHDFISQKTDSQRDLAKIPTRMPYVPMKQWLETVTQAVP